DEVAAEGGLDPQPRRSGLTAREEDRGRSPLRPRAVDLDHLQDRLIGRCGPEEANRYERIGREDPTRAAFGVGAAMVGSSGGGVPTRIPMRAPDARGR